MRRIRFIFVFMLVSVLAATAQSKVYRYDGRWWKSLSGDAQTAFLAGYYDCYIWDVSGTAYSDGPLMQEASNISKYYRSSVGAENTLVLQVVKSLNTGKKHAAVQTKDKYGENDGDYWRQMGHEERYAFVRGYVSCQSEYLNLSFSKPISSYVSAISKWYGINDQDISDLNPKTGNDKIANVLRRLSDKPAPTPSATTKSREDGGLDSHPQK